jgi:rhodanese-related sulfurtransferase
MSETTLLLAVGVGFGFGFVLERAGFGRAQKLLAQFFGDDMTVFKVMFGAIVTAMLGAVLLDGLGLLDLAALSASATSETWLWPMIAGGLLLGVGFVVSGYCPGTSIVAAASGKLDGLAVVVGVVGGTVAWGELMNLPWFAAFNESEAFARSGYLGSVFLYDLLGLPAPVMALLVAAMAAACFVGAERLERIFSHGAAPAPAPLPRRLVFAGFGALAALGLATLALPSPTAAVPAAPARIAPLELARRVVEAPWTVRVLDLRPAAACAEARVPGAECLPSEGLAALDLGGGGPARDLVLVAAGDLAALPAEAAAHRGRVLALEGGFEAWRTVVLSPPAPPAPGAPPAEVEAFRVRSGLHAALTGVAAPPPPAAPPPAAARPRKKAGGGGCGG